MLTKTIDGLFIGTRYGVWVLGVLGILGSIILMVANISIGLTSALLCVGMLCLSISVALALLPKQLVLNTLLEKRFLIAGIAVIFALVIVGILYFTNGGFPELNLLFI